MTLINNNTYVTVFVIAFAAFIVAGLAIVPAFVQDADADRKKPKKVKADFTIDEPVIELVKNKDKGPKKDKVEYIIEEPVIELVKNTKDKKPKHNTDFPIDEPVIKLVKTEKDKKPK